jgi:NADH dehydrogenase [ubiquinone] 1 alpha subcomplex assembly factor 5
MPAQDQLFNQRLGRLRRQRAARSGGDFFLHRRALDELIERLDLVARPFAAALDLSLDPFVAARLRARGFEVVEADEDDLPNLAGRFDLVTSVGRLDTINDLPGALALIRRALRPDGLFLAAFAGAGSLPRLRRAMRAAEEAQGSGAAARIHPQIDVRAAGDLLTRAGFALPVADRDVVEVRYGGLMRLVGDLRAMAATNQLAGQAARPVGRLGLAAAIADFAAGAGPDGKTAERFEIVHLSGWAPAPGQPRPARRGSATASLADALKARG